MRKFFYFIWLASISYTVGAQEKLSLDSCRALAIANNKTLLINRENIQSARYRRKAAFTNYLPEISATGGYIRNQKEISLLSDEQKTSLSALGTQLSGSMQTGIKGMLAQNPELAQNPLFTALVQSLGSMDLATSLNSTGQSIVDALRTDTRNIYTGALSLTQPIYTGGKIRAYNKITGYAEELARQQYDNSLQDVILSTDQAYWQVVSLAGKKKLAEGYLELLRKLESDVNHMITEGVATKADGLSVRVKVNEAEMTLTKVEDGLSLSRMLLCQLCGLDLTRSVSLEDEQATDIGSTLSLVGDIDMDNVYASRPEIRSLELATQIFKQKVRIARSEFLPSVAFVGNYIMSNPSTFNGFENKFKGMWNVGVMLKVPVWHWGKGIYTVKAAKAEARIAEYKLEEAKEKIELQVNQAAFKIKEAAKKLIMAEKNLEKANENLRYANLGFEEGVIAASNVLEAHTAWLSAQSEKIDAQIDVRLTDIYLKRALGRITGK